jgi:parvulin-like peptidyl-prolyl isomerase
MVRFEHIYVDLRGKNEQERQDARQLLDRIYRRIRSGSTTFDSVASEAADDATYSADDFGYLLRNDPRGVQLLGRSFVDEVFALDEGDVDGVLESSVAVHIVHVLDKRTPRILELDDPILPGQPVTVRQQIRNLIAQQKQQQVLGQAVQSVVEDLRSEAEVTVFDQNIPW